MKRLVLLLLPASCGFDINSEPAGESIDPDDGTAPGPDSTGIDTDNASDACAASPEALADCIDIDRYASDLAFIANPRPPGSEHWGQVRDLCAARLEAAGYTVERQDYGTGTNVIGRKDGTSAPNEVVLVSAHYDHIASCPGADDNATGVAAALEIGRVLALADLPRTVMIACWDEEEIELRGSSAFASSIEDRGIDIVVNYNFDMIGYASSEPETQTLTSFFYDYFPDAAAGIVANGRRADFILVVANAAAQTAAIDVLAQADRIALGTALFEVPEGLELTETYAETRRSDHAPLWAAGVPAVLFTDTALLRNPNYHCAGGPDVPEDLDDTFATNVARAVTAASAIAAGM